MDVDKYFPEECQNPAYETGINILLLLAGIVAVLGIMGIPIWIVMLVKANEHNRKLEAKESDPNLTN